MGLPKTPGSDSGCEVKGQLPSLTELFIADEQPAEADPKTLAYLRAHPEMRRLIERQKALEREAEEMAARGEHLPSEFETPTGGD